MKILVFTEGTIMMHPALRNIPRNQRVSKSKTIKRTTGDFSRNIPIDNVVNKLWTWKKQGATIYYLTSRATQQEVANIKYVLEKFNFPDNQNLLFRKQGEQYKDVAEQLMPDILVEDDCESIGGEVEMTHPHIRADLKRKIKPVVVKEFGGIDHLSDNISKLSTL